MNKLLSTLFAGVFAAALGTSAFAAEPASTTDAVKSSSAAAAPMKHKHMKKTHKAEKIEAKTAVPEVAK